MNEFTFLTAEQTFGDNQLDILKKYGTKCSITDFAILLGGCVSTNNHTWENDCTSCWWIKTPYARWWSNLPYGPDAFIVNHKGVLSGYLVDSRSLGGRPVLSYSSIASSCSNIVRRKIGILEVEYGEYPQTVVSKDFSRMLERSFLNMPYSKNEMKIKPTGKSYTTDSVVYYRTDTPFQARKHNEYEYGEKKYIRILGDENSKGKVLSDGRTIQVGESYWVEVEPIKWMIDEKTDIALSKKIIFSGVQFNIECNYKGDFDKTDIKKFMDRDFSRDIVPSLLKDESKTNDKCYPENIVQNLSKEEKELQDKENLKKSLEKLKKIIGEAKEEARAIEEEVQGLKKVLSKK